MSFLLLINSPHDILQPKILPPLHLFASENFKLISAIMSEKAACEFIYPTLYTLYYIILGCPKSFYCFTRK